ncbi:hypothetical protein [Reyranella sp.]|uniref:hypothetical protein n=1 Tax=Reyranella sp. TaxID=1929291 RepID=UPI0027319116|nr:hypothetical protein [Reyranella sp.]MDP2377797.1 hypothetical protein [Reyranella sp.]
MRSAVLAIAVLVIGATAAGAQEREVPPPRVRVIELTEPEVLEVIQILEMAVMARGFAIDRQARAFADRFGRAPIKPPAPPPIRPPDE